MDYHLNHNGQNLGTFPLEELRQRRAAGALTGAELVWRPGMASWQPLDTVLQSGASRSLPPPIPAAAQKSDHTALIVVVSILAFFLFVCLIAGYSVKRFVSQTSRAFQQIGAGSSAAYGRKDAMTAASAPVVVSSNSMTATRVTEREREFRVRQYGEGYRQRGEHNPATDVLALGLVENWIACNYNGTVNTNLPSLAELSDQLANNPACTDPLVLTVTADNCVELHETVHRLERALKGFENSRHLGYPKFYAAALLGDKIYEDREFRLPALDATALRYFKAALSDGSLLPGDQPEIADVLVSGWAGGFFNRNSDAIISAVRERGETFSWLALVLEGEQQINLAWQARGSGYASEVSADGWSGFNEHLASARSDLTEAWQLQPDRPLAPCLMMTVSLGDSNIGEMREWFDRTTSAQIDYAGAWKEMRWGLRPRWYGSEEAMLAFGVTALNTRRFDTDVPRQFYDSVSDLQTEMGTSPAQFIFGHREIWPHLEDMYEGYIAVTEGEKQRSWRSSYAVVAYLAGKTDVACRQLAALDWQPAHWNLTGWNRDLSLMAGEMAARSSAQSQQVNTAEGCRQADDFEGALTIYRSLTTSNLNPAAQNFVNERIYSLETEIQLQKNGWVNFLPATTNFTGWQVERGQCKVLPDGALEVQSDENGHLLYSRVRVGTDFEVRGQFELVHSTDNQFQGGLVMGVPQFETQNWYAFRMKQTTADGDVASFSQQWSRRQVLAPAIINAGTNTFWFSYQNGRVSATVNGREVFQGSNPPENTYVTTNEFLLGLGAFNNSNKTVIRYRNLQVHLRAGG